jgi:hypothetical protein
MKYRGGQFTVARSANEYYCCVDRQRVGGCQASDPGGEVSGRGTPSKRQMLVLLVFTSLQNGAKARSKHQGPRKPI